MRPTINVLDDDLLGQIVTEAKRVLAEVGLEIRGQALREQLLDAGLRFDATGERILFPQEVVAEALQQAPSSFTLYDRSGRPQLPLRRGLVSEPDRLRRGRDSGRDRPGHADGADRSGHARRRDGLPHRGRARRDHDRAADPPRGAGALRRRTCHVPHARRELADGRDRGAAPRRRLHFLRPIEALDDLPVTGLVNHVLAENHLIMAEHTTRHWPQELWLTGPTIDRTNRETGEERTERDLVDRANAEVDRRLAAYQPVETDPALDAELREIVQSGMGGAELPELPPPGVPTSGDGPTRRRNRRRG